MNEDGEYFGRFEKSANDSVRFRVRDYEADEISGQAVFNVSAPSGALLSLDFNNTEPLQTLAILVDEDADGTVDREQAPDSVVTGLSSSDTTSPETTAASTGISATQSKITLTSTDGQDGSGVAATYYLIEGDTELRTYTEPFNVAVGKVVQFYSVDKAGNTDSLQEIRAAG